MIFFALTQIPMTDAAIAVPGMTSAETFYFGCFLAGLLLCIVSLVGGLGHISWHFHPPQVTHIPVLPHSAHRVPANLSSTTIPWWNAFSIMAFLCWFGAAGYLMTRYGSLVAGAVFALASLCGLIGGAVVFWFLTRVLLKHERELTAYETAVPGAVGRVSSAIRPGGTGEVLYEQLGARRSVPARSETGAAIPQGEEVFVLRYEQGIAYVRRWEDIHESPQTHPEGLTSS